MRICRKCGVEKPLENFVVSKASRGGRTHECRTCANLRVYEWNKNNRSKVLETNAKWRAANLVSAREKGRANTKRWQAANPEKVREYSINRRAREKASRYYDVSSQYLKRVHASPCFYCGSKDFVEADHVIPLSRGGSHSVGNLVPACRVCNASKKDRFIMEWRTKCLMYR